MKTIPMTARRAFRYAGRALAAGAPFNARSEADALILASNGNAKRAAPTAAAREPAPGRYRTRVMTAEPAPQEPPQTAPMLTKDAETVDELDSMDADALRELAERRRIPFHYRAGAEKLRAAIREAGHGAAEE